MRQSLLVVLQLASGQEEVLIQSQFHFLIIQSELEFAAVLLAFSLECFLVVRSHEALKVSHEVDLVVVEMPVSFRESLLVESDSRCANDYLQLVLLVFRVDVGGFRNLNKVRLSEAMRIQERNLHGLSDSLDVIGQQLLENGDFTIGWQLKEHFNVVFHVQTCALSQLLYLVHDFSGDTHLLKLVVQG